jgi:AraC-like DNA-binding protein/mannose-6-phosphate isomerase-like protein (cupin superfamily)
MVPGVSGARLPHPPTHPAMKPIAEHPSLPSTLDLVACTVVKGRDFGDVWHYHPLCEITLVLRGGTERWVGDTLETLTPGSIAFLGPNVPHDYRNTPLPARRPGPVEAVVVHFPVTLLGEGWHERTDMRPLCRLFGRACRGLRVGGATREPARRLLVRMVRERGLRRLILLLELLDRLARSPDLSEIASEGFRLENQSYASDRIGTVCAHIERNLNVPLRVPELAHRLGLSESAFSRLFKKGTGCTVPQYVNRLRIAHACRLLAETDRTVAEIVRLCGYASPAHFQRQFRALQLCTPQTYRRTVRAPFGTDRRTLKTGTRPKR